VEDRPSLVAFFPEEAQKRPYIYVDSREASTKNGQKIVKKLKELGAKVVIRKLDFGDFLIGEDVVVERKTVHDLVSTLTQRFLFDQIFNMKAAYPKAILLIEGYMGILRKFRRITPEAINGTLFAIAQANIPIVPTIDYQDTATFIVTAAKQLLKEGKIKAVIRHRPKAKNIQQKQVYAVTGLPHVGTTLAANLLKQLGSVRQVFNASKEDLKAVNGIGPLNASRIVEVLDAPYVDEEQKAEKRNPTTDV
jgi:ERCC4-type nuclease